MAPLLGLAMTPESRAQTVAPSEDRRRAGGPARFRRIRRRGRARAGVHAVTPLLDGSAAGHRRRGPGGAVRARARSPRPRSDASRRATPRSAPSPTSPPSARSRKADAIDAARARGRDARPARRRAVRGQEPVRREGPADPRRLEDQPRPAAGRTRTRRWSRGWRRPARFCVGALNMGEYAYDFTGENAHDGPSRNPHDLAHMTGGSSGGSGAAVAGGLRADRARLRHQRLDPRADLVLRPLRPEADLRPAVARAARFRSSPASIISGRLRALGRRSRAELRRDAGPRRGRSRAGRRRRRAGAPSLDEGDRRACASRGSAAISRAAASPARSRRSTASRAALKAERTVELPRRRGRARGRLSHHHGRGRGAASGAPARRAPDDFDPDVRDRLIAGAMLPGAWVVQAQKFRRLFRERRRWRCSATSTCCSRRRRRAARPTIGQKTFVLDGARDARSGRTSASSRSRSPSSACRSSRCRSGRAGETLPIGVQIIAPPWREDLALRVARALERDGVVAAPVAVIA